MAAMPAAIDAGVGVDDAASSALADDLGHADVGRRQHRHAPPHRLESGKSEILRQRGGRKHPGGSKQRLLVSAFDVAGHDREPPIDPAARAWAASEAA